MQRRSTQQPDLFLITETPEDKLPSTARPQVLQLLGELMWSVLKTQAIEVVQQETSDD